MKKLRTRVIRLLIFCTLLAANWLALLPGSTTAFAKPTGRPANLAHSQIVDPPIFKQDNNNRCKGSPNDFDMTPKTDSTFYNGKAHYRILTINKGKDGGKCDHLSWDIHKTVPQAAMNTCRFFMHFAGIDSPIGFRVKLLDNRKHVIKTSGDPSVPGNGSIDVKGVHVVEADLSNAGDAGTPIDVGILFVDCNSVDLGRIEIQA